MTKKSSAQLIAALGEKDRERDAHRTLLQTITTDEHAGKGGSYVIDAAGKRRPADPGEAAPDHSSDQEA